MCPKPHVGLCLDVLLEHTHILLAVAELLAFNGLDGVEGYLIVAAANTAHAAVDEVGTQLYAHDFATGDDGRILVEKLHPLRLGTSLRTLVGDESEQRLLAFAYHSEDGTQRLLLRYAH